MKADSFISPFLLKHKNRKVSKTFRFYIHFAPTSSDSGMLYFLVSQLKRP